MVRGHSYRSWVEVNLEHFNHNWRTIRSLVGADVKVLQVVKADAYGHGAIELSNAALKNGADMLGVANADEGSQIRISGISAPILILSPSDIAELPAIIKYELTPSVSDFTFAKELQRKAASQNITAVIHIEVDTGMGRGGIIFDEALLIIKKITALKNITVEGIFTHLAVSELNDAHNDLQMQRFRKLLETLKNNDLHIPIKHIANSGAVLNFPHFHLNMVRPGLMTFGIYPDDTLKDKAELLQVMSFKTKIILLKKFPPNYNIGYGKTFTTKKTTIVATIPVGYADGLPRLLSNQGTALIGGIRCPIIGRVSMDMCTVDVSKVKSCALGDEVVLLGEQGKNFISANEIAQKTQSISYEIICALGKRAPRIFVGKKGKADAIEPQLRRTFVPEEDTSQQRIDSIIRHCLQARANNEELGNAIYYEMVETLFGKKDRPLELRTNMRYRIALAEFSKREITKEPSLADSFKVTIHIEYIKNLRQTNFMVGCAQNNQQLEALFQDPSCEYRWLLDQSSEAIRAQDFTLQAVRVDGKNAEIIKEQNTLRGFEIFCLAQSLKDKLHKPVKIELEIVTRKRKDAKLFSVFLVYPTRGAQIVFNYKNADISQVREVSFFAGKAPYPKIIRTIGKQTEVNISENEWIFPNSGVTFFWE